MPKSAITRVTNLAVTPSTTPTITKNSGFYAPPLTPAQIAAIPTATLINGAIVYNTTTNTFQVYQSGGWTNLSTAPVTNVLVAPNISTANAATAGNGNIYYDTTTSQLTTAVSIANAATYTNVYTTPLTSLGNLVIQSAAADPANIQGVIAFNTISNSLRTYDNNAMGTIYISPGAANSNGNLVLQSANADPANSGNGMMYWNTNVNTLRVYGNGAWHVVAFV